MQLDDIFKNTHNLPTVPEVVRELIQSFNDDKADVASTAAKLAMDQVLMARVLRLANCARYGLARKVASVDDAFMVLGFNAVRTLVVASGLTGAFKAPAGFNLTHFWRMSLATAGYATWIAKSIGKREDIAFTGGLMLRVGVLLLQIEAPDASAAIAKTLATGGSRAAMEQAVLGFTHADVGAELAARWNFPEEMVEGFKAYPAPLAAEPFKVYGAIFHLADYVADSLFREEDAETLAAGLPKDVLVKLGLDGEKFLAALPSLKEMTAGLDELLG